MNAQSYIKNKIQELVEKFPQLKAGYSFEPLTMAHYIKIEPSKEFNQNNDYIAFETDFILSFIDRYPFEEIVFITEEDIIDLEDPSFIVEGMLFTREGKNYPITFADIAMQILQNSDININISESDIILNQNLYKSRKMEHDEIVVRPLPEESFNLDEFHIKYYPFAA